MDQLIRALEVYTASEVDEKWLYELADLYHKAGIEDKCVATCDRIMLLFGLGKYVDKAMDLKLQYAPLNKYQMDLVENRDNTRQSCALLRKSTAEMPRSWMIMMRDPDSELPSRCMQIMRMPRRKAGRRDVQTL